MPGYPFSPLAPARVPLVLTTRSQAFQHGTNRRPLLVVAVDHGFIALFLKLDLLIV